MGIEPISEGWEALAGTDSPKKRTNTRQTTQSRRKFAPNSILCPGRCHDAMAQITLLIGTIVGANERAFGGRFSELSDAESVIFRCVPNQAL